ncbi:MAG: hypothetical protein F6K29_34575 [Okeania sp. SIO2G5]|nr:hypothetical protein [Okeania sp. SIO2G5]
MPTILDGDDISVAIYAGEGSRLALNLEARLADMDRSKLFAFAVIADSDKKTPSKVTSDYKDSFDEILPNFPDEPGAIISGDIRLGIYVLPDNKSQGVLDTVLCQCGAIAYPDSMEKAAEYLNYFSADKRREIGAKWKPFDYEKAQVATVVSILKPGKTNTVSIADNKWVSEETLDRIPALKQLNVFLRELLD